MSNDTVVQQFIMSMPEELRVASFDIAIVRWGAHAAVASRRWGEFSSIEQAIKIDMGMPTLAKLLDTLVHEILHAVFWAAGIEDDDKEERTVSLMSTCLAGVFRDNPDLVYWIASVNDALLDQRMRRTSQRATIQGAMGEVL